MALTATITPAELVRQARLVYETLPYEVFLVDNSTAGLGVNDTYADWKAEEVSGNGYAAITGVLGYGTYNSVTQRYEIPPLVCTFTAAGGSIAYTTLCVRIGTEAYLHSIQVESLPDPIADGSMRTYLITLIQND